MGKEIKPEASERLQEVCGNSLRKLSSEIDKLITYVGERRSIELSDVEALASAGEANIFALLNALAMKNPKKSLSLFQILYKNKAEPFGMLSLLASQYRVMLYTKFEKNAQRIGASPYFVKKCLARAGGFTEEELKRNLELILETDLKLKSGEQTLATMELLLTSLCQDRHANKTP